MKKTNRSVNTLTFQMPLDEQVRIGFRRKFLRRRLLTSLVLLFFLGVGFLFLGDSAVYVGIFCSTYALFAPLHLYLSIRRFLRQHPQFTAPTTLSFDDTGITLSSPGNRMETAWSCFRRWSQTDAHLLLFLDDDGTAVTIPKRAFGKDQLESFMVYVRRLQALNEIIG